MTDLFPVTMALWYFALRHTSRGVYRFDLEDSFGGMSYHIGVFGASIFHTTYGAYVISVCEYIGNWV